MAVRVARRVDVGDDGGGQDAPGFVERVAWRRGGASSRRFFVVLAFVVALAVLLPSLLAAVVAERNAASVAAARGRGERVATAVADFEDHLGQANDEIGTSLVAGETQSSSSRARYEDELLASSLALTRAGLDATGRNAERIRLLARDLDEGEADEGEGFATLIVMARAYPTGSRFYRDARRTVNEALAPRATRTRAAAHRQISGNADLVAGPRTTGAIAGMVVSLVTLALTALLVAGRTRIRLHPAFLVAGLLLGAQLVVVSYGLWTERDEMRAAAGRDLTTYTEAQAAATTVFAMRAAETEAQAGTEHEPVGSANFDVEARSADFDAGAAALGVEGFAPRSGSDRTLHVPAAMTDAASEYARSVERVRDLAAAADSDDESAEESEQETAEEQAGVAYRSARGVAVSLVNRSTADLTARLDDAADAGVAWPVPLVLGAAAAALAAVGVLWRGRAYVWWSA